ncbi:MAG: hypothetical protein EOO28_16490 [Comamonadaceae bacterium]|nr:MAG: hypothetical protein EOO28_16490 [Comamonadaceae bacterium]
MIHPAELPLAPKQPQAVDWERFFNGAPAADEGTVSAEHLEVTYANSCDLLDQENFDGALELLVYLMKNDPYDFRFQFGYGLCLQHLQPPGHGVPALLAASAARR